MTKNKMGSSGTLGTVIVGLSVVLTAVATVAYYTYENFRYRTNNRNALGDNFNVHPNRTCPVCIDDLHLDSPDCTILHCGHTIHDECLREMNNARNYFETLLCPVCRTPIQI